MGIAKKKFANRMECDDKKIKDKNDLLVSKITDLSIGWFLFLIFIREITP